MSNKNDPLTKNDLYEFTDQVFLPAIDRIVDAKIEEKVVPQLGKLKVDLMLYFDEKIADLRGDIIVLLRKEDRRFIHLVDLLYQKKILDKSDIKAIDEVELFPRTK